MNKFSRRRFLQRTATSVVGSAAASNIAFAAEGVSRARGIVSGEPAAEKAGGEILAQGGNVVDAMVCAALTAAVASPHNTGIGGYGGHMTIALADSGKVTSIDFNSTAPAAAREDMFPVDGKGNVRSTANQFGWLAAGVPGVLAGMQFALERYGTRRFGEMIAPAIKLARDGFPLSAGLAGVFQSCSAQFETDEGSRKLYFKDGAPVRAGEIFKNPDLAAMLTTLAERNSADSFYHGDIAQQIAGAFKKNGGIVTVEDLAAYRAREVKPLSQSWPGFDIYTAPLTAGGLTILQALEILRALGWGRQPDDFALTHSRIEALRFAWHDRLRWLGDPSTAGVPIAKLLSPEYAYEAAEQIGRVVKEGKILPLETKSRPQTGTIHLSASDRNGNMAACTLTHGGSFGARVTVDGLGLTLGHGMSRFEPAPGHPNSPGPSKRPLHNMCPTIVLSNGKPVLALGGRGGRQIPNAVFEVLARFVVLGRSMDEAVAAPRIHTEGGVELKFEPAWPMGDKKGAERAGYKIATGPAAVVSAVSFDPATGESRATTR